MQTLYDSNHSLETFRWYGDGDWGLRGDGCASYANSFPYSWNGNGDGAGSEAEVPGPCVTYTITPTSTSLREQIILTNSLPLVHYRE